jgi:uncharacterized membrane protein (UPF0136 family)
MNLIDGIIIAYGGLLLAGGLMGAKAGSKVSLIMGLLSAAVTGVGYYVALSDALTGHRIVLTVSAVLTIVFLMRFLKTKKVFPGAVLAIVSLLVSAFLFWKIYLAS